MIRKLLEANKVNITDSEFKVVMQMTTDDIKFNRTSFGKRTSKDEVMTIVMNSVLVVRRCA